MTDLVALGINHNGAAVELRERLAVSEEERASLLDALEHDANLREAMVVSTCNRVEIYGVSDDAKSSGTAALDVLARCKNVPIGELRTAAFVRESFDAARHIFRVASSLESIVIGEPQILGQVKAGYQHAKDHGRVGPVLDRCLSLAFKGAKRVRTETEIARGGASVPSVAVDLATSIFGDLTDSAVLVVGAGEMAQAAAVHLRAAGVPEIVVVNRSVERGEALARAVEGRFEPWDRLEAELVRADVVISSTGSKLPIIDKSTLKPVMKKRRQRPLFLVDIAVPRDVASDVSRANHVFLYNVDDLQSIVHDNLRSRQGEARRAEALVDEEVDGFVQWMRSRAVGPLIGALQGRARGIVDAEVARALTKLPDLDPAQRKVLQKLAQSVAQKLLHSPMSAVRQGANGPVKGLDGAQLAESLSVLFALDEPDPRARGQSSKAEGDAPAAKPRPEPS
ncbi:MAG: glutamyl-tRNA reductase [Nannocystales bacterium]